MICIKVIGNILCYAVVAAATIGLTVTSCNVMASQVKYGDVSGDGAVDSADYTVLRSYLLGKVTNLPAPIGI